MFVEVDDSSAHRQGNRFQAQDSLLVPGWKLYPLLSLSRLRRNQDLSTSVHRAEARCLRFLISREAAKAAKIIPRPAPYPSSGLHRFTALKRGACNFAFFAPLKLGPYNLIRLHRNRKESHAKMRSCSQHYMIMRWLVRVRRQTTGLSPGAPPPRCGPSLFAPQFSRLGDRKPETSSHGAEKLHLQNLTSNS